MCMNDKIIESSYLDNSYINRYLKENNYISIVYPHTTKIIYYENKEYIGCDWYVEKMIKKDKNNLRSKKLKRLLKMF